MMLRVMPHLTLPSTIINKLALGAPVGGLEVAAKVGAVPRDLGLGCKT